MKIDLNIGGRRLGHPSRYQPHSTELNFGDQMGTGVFQREQLSNVLLYILFKRLTI